MSDRIPLRGYAVPFARTRWIESEGVIESIAPGAFDAMLARGDSVPLLFGSHDESAPVMATRVSLHADGYGLGFSAMIDADLRNPNWGRLRAMVSGFNPSDQCSVMLHIEDKRPGVLGDHLASHTVTRAFISHIAVTASAAYGSLTGVWRGDCDLFAAPNRLQNMAALWADGRAAWNARQKRDAVPARAVRNSAGVPAKLAALLGPRMDHYRRVREAYAQAFAAGKLSGAIFAHVAFTKAAGFDGNFNRLGASVRPRSQRGA